jgi:hypothetical protein
MIIIKTKRFFQHNHKIKGWQGTKPYLTVGGIQVDGIGRIHTDLYGECTICKKKIIVAKTHLPENPLKK